MNSGQRFIVDNRNHTNEGQFKINTLPSICVRHVCVRVCVSFIGAVALSVPVAQIKTGHIDYRAVHYIRDIVPQPNRKPLKF